MTVLTTLGIVFLLSFLVETLVEFLFGTVAGAITAAFPALEGKMGAFKPSVVQACAVAAGIGGAFLYKFDVLFLSGMFLQNPIALTPYGMCITGIAIGKGSNYIHQLIAQFFPVKQPLMPYAVTAEKLGGLTDAEAEARIGGVVK